MKNVKKKLLILLSSCTLALMMVFNVSVSMEGESVGTDISLSGISVSAVSTSGESGQVQCKCAWNPLGNNECRADNSGNACRNLGNEDCRDMDGNCGS